jgi:hypothetical protein
LKSSTVIPAKAGIHSACREAAWIPAFAAQDVVVLAPSRRSTTFAHPCAARMSRSGRSRTSCAPRHSGIRPSTGCARATAGMTERRDFLDRNKVGETSRVGRGIVHPQAPEQFTRPPLPLPLPTAATLIPSPAVREREASRARYARFVNSGRGEHIFTRPFSPQPYSSR